MAEKLGDVSSSLSAQLTAAEARIAVGDTAEALRFCERSKPSVTTLRSRVGMHCINRSRRSQELPQLTRWRQNNSLMRSNVNGQSYFQMYISRPDLRGSADLVSRLSHTNRQ